MPENEEMKIEYEENLLEEFARAISPDIKAFFQSDEGRLWYEEWLHDHPEYQR